MDVVRSGRAGEDQKKLEKNWPFNPPIREYNKDDCGITWHLGEHKEGAIVIAPDTDAEIKDGVLHSDTKGLSMGCKGNKKPKPKGK